MYRALRKSISRALMRLRLSAWGNNHSLRLNLRYRRYHRKARDVFRRSFKGTRSAEAAASVEKFRRDGFVVIPSRLDAAASEALKKKVDSLFEAGDTVQVSAGLHRLIDGAEKMPEIISLFPGHLAETIEGYLQSNFKIYTMSFYRTVPDASAPAASFLWHFDNSPDEEVKLMIYLDHVTEDTGAFRFKNYQTSEEARAQGFWHRDDYAKAKDIFEDEASTIVAEGPPATAVLFRQGRVVHKATAPQRDHRDVVTMVLIPSLIPWREHYARNRHLLSTNSGLCKNPWTDEPENIGYRY